MIQSAIGCVNNCDDLLISLVLRYLSVQKGYGLFLSCRKNIFMACVQIIKQAVEVGMQYALCYKSGKEYTSFLKV